MWLDDYFDNFHVKSPSVLSGIIRNNQFNQNIQQYITIHNNDIDTDIYLNFDYSYYPDEKHRWRNRDDEYYEVTYLTDNDDDLPIRILYGHQGEVMTAEYGTLNGRDIIHHRNGDKPAIINFNFTPNYDTVIPSLNKVEYYKNGKKHRDGDNPAYIKFYDDKHTIYGVEFWNNGALHRNNNQPAIIEYHHGDISMLQYWTHGNITKYISYHDKSTPKEIKYFDGEYYKSNTSFMPKDGYHKDDDTPAVIYYYKNGAVKSELYYKHGKLHRKGDKPAIIHYYDDASHNMSSIEYYQDGNRYRDTENVKIEYLKDETGQIRYERYTQKDGTVITQDNINFMK